MEFMPLRMRPCYKEYLWGGGRLRCEFGKTDAPEVTAESWELAAHPDGNSVIAEGPLAGRTLDDLGVLDRSGFWGTSCLGDTFPIMVKLIDAEKDLSIQVHPSDETMDPAAGEQGKTEMWYIVDCAPQSCIYFGFRERIGREETLRRARDGTICEALNRVSVQKGDCFYILPGTIHAIGAGCLVAEIQQNSNTTFRVYDYQRLDANGLPRRLHLERASQVMDYEPMMPNECKANSISVFPEFTMAEMFSCEYFRAYKLDVRERADLLCDGSSFQHLLCVEGAGTLETRGRAYPVQRGDSFFLPAALGEYRIQGACRMLLSRV